MLPHQYPHPKRTTRIVSHVHGGKGMVAGATNNPTGAFHTRTTKGFTHVRGRGPPGVLVPHDVPHAVRHRTPQRIFRKNDETWGGPTDAETDHDARCKFSVHAAVEGDGHWAHVERARKDGHTLAHHGSVDFDFLRPSEGYDNKGDSVRISGSMVVHAPKEKWSSLAYASGAGRRDLITHKPARGVDPRTVTPLVPPVSPRGAQPRSPRTGRYRNAGYNIVNNQLHPENEAKERADREALRTTCQRKQTMVPSRKCTLVHAALVPGGPPEEFHKTGKPQAVLSSEGHAYNIMTGDTYCPDKLKKFDARATKSFRRLARAFEDQRAVRLRGKARADQKRQRRRNNIARTAYMPRKQQHRGFNIVNGARHRDLPAEDPRNDLTHRGEEPPSVWAKVSREPHDLNTLEGHPMKGINNTAGRAEHTKLPRQMPKYLRMRGETLGKLPDRVTRQQDLVYNDLLGHRFGNINNK